MKTGETGNKLSNILLVGLVGACGGSAVTAAWIAYKSGDAGFLGVAISGTAGFFWARRAAEKIASPQSDEGT